MLHTVNYLAVWTEKHRALRYRLVIVNDRKQLIQSPGPVHDDSFKKENSQFDPQYFSLRIYYHLTRVAFLPVLLS